ncbi:MAG TPA: hypothetical protein VNR11_21305 [Xanthobacteraceae bacterium]|nr:hypothetical protein [Xanthobacteraceae bacterium]
MLQSNPRTEIERKALDAWLTILLFALVLLVPAAAQLFGIGAASSENRTLAPFPKIDRLKEIKDLPRLADAYVNDRFGLRAQLVHANSLLRYRMGLSSSKDVVIGKDGWLFYTGDRSLERHTGAYVLKREEVDAWVRQMEAYRDWLEKRGIAFYILAAPDKNTIYPEKLPDYPRSPGATTPLDQVVARLKTSSLEFIDPRAALVEAKQLGEQVYFEGDTHWTQRGAFVAYNLLMDRVRRRFPTVTALTIDDYDVSVDTAPAADLARLLSLEGVLDYSVERFRPRAGRQIGSVTTSRPGWPWRVTEIRTNLQNRPRLLILGDSFTDYVLGPNFLYETFRDPVWTHHNLGGFNFDLVKEVAPAVVIYQFAERFLHVPVGKPRGMD